MKLKVPESKKAFLADAKRLAKTYNVRITNIVVVGDEVYARYNYDDEKEFNEFINELRRKYNFDVIPDKTESYTV
jgi:RNase H-fold protein (predicted Holliday junction resolvase)